MYLGAIVLAAGRGKRIKSRTPKPLIKVSFRPLITYCLNTLSRLACIRDIIVVVNRGNSKGITASIKRHRIDKIRNIVLGGLRRQDSVSNGLKALAKRCDFVLIHDADRPFIDSKMLLSIIKEAQKSGAAIAGVPVKATIKKVVSYQLSVFSKFAVAETLNRENLWEAQTPQVFRKDLILRAYDKFADKDATDDAMLMEKLGVKVNVVLGSYNNIKITTPEDLVIAEVISKSYKL